MAPHAINVTAADRQHKGRKYPTLVAPSAEQYVNTTIGPALYWYRYRAIKFCASQGVCLAKLLSHLPKNIYTFKYQPLPAQM